MLTLNDSKGRVEFMGNHYYIHNFSISLKLYYNKKILYKTEHSQQTLLCPLPPVCLGWGSVLQLETGGRKEYSEEGSVEPRISAPVSSQICRGCLSLTLASYPQLPDIWGQSKKDKE